MSNVSTLRERVHALESPQCEVVLQRRCLDVSKASYTLRCNGDLVPTSLLQRFDAGLRSGTEETLYRQLTDEGWLQATLGVDAGGLGLRDATSIVLPAFLASRTTARPLVAEMAEHLHQAGICEALLFMEEYDLRTSSALDRWCATLPQEVSAQVH